MRNILWILAFAMILVGAKDADNIKKTVDAKSYLASIHSKQIEPKALYKFIDDDEEEIYIVDIREPDQIGHGEIYHENLIVITRGYLEFSIERRIPDKSAKVIIYCCTGSRSNLAVKTLKDMGYTDVISLKGGIVRWVQEGYPLDTVYGEVFLK